MVPGIIGGQCPLFALLKLALGITSTFSARDDIRVASELVPVFSFCFCHTPQTVV